MAHNFKINSQHVRDKIKEIRDIYDSDAILSRKKEQELVVSLSYMVRSAVSRYRNFPNYDDLYQEGMIGLLKAIKKYDITKTFDFFRYAMWWIEARIYRSIGKINLIRIKGNVEESKRTFKMENISDDHIVEPETPEYHVLKEEQLLKLRKALDTLPSNHKSLIEKRFGLLGKRRESLEQLSQEFHMTREGLRQLEKRILGRLKANEFFNE